MCPIYIPILWCVVRGGKLMLYFLLLKKFKLCGPVKKSISRILFDKPDDGDVDEVNIMSDRFVVHFWRWVIGNVRALHPDKMKTPTLWLSFMLRTRGLSWAGMDLLCSHGVVAPRRQIEIWEKRSAEFAQRFARYLPRICWSPLSTLTLITDNQLYIRTRHAVVHY